MTTLICDCNQTMPLEAKALGHSLDESLHLHSSLCRREAQGFLNALKGGEGLVVACTQEKRLFEDLAQQAREADPALPWVPIKFVNIRETAGWGRESAQAMPKIAALLAQAQMPDAEPVPTVTYKSAGRLLIVAELGRAQALADVLGDGLDITLMSDGVTRGMPAQERRYPVIAGEWLGLSGWLGAFNLQWRRSNPIDLDLCTRCNACVAACPEQAIGLDYQIDLTACQSHRDCVKACGVAGAIDFQREPSTESAEFDLVLDLRSASAFDRHALPQGYFRQDDMATLLRLREMVGEFEKPKFFQYKASICAHSRNTQIGCNACVDVCSAQAISSEPARQQIKVNPHLCVGCGACTTVCPTGALTYAYPQASALGVTAKTLLSTYARAGGKDAVLLLHSQGQGQAMLNELGRAAQLQRAHGLPARVIPMSLWHTASVGADVWLSMLAFGAAQVVVLATDEEAPQYAQAVQDQMAQVQAVLHGLGYPGQHLTWLQADSVDALDAQLKTLPAAPARPATPAKFALTSDKRSTLALALDHWMTHAPAAHTRPEAIALPTAGAFWGGVQVDAQACTLCLSCVSACPASALQDNPDQPELAIIEKNCVQCGLCVTTCPENAIQTVPRLLLTPARHERQVLNQSQPYSCVRCSKPFGTLKAIEAMLGKLSGHAMFQGAAAERLKMCSDCRVIDIYSAGDEQRIV